MADEFRGWWNSSTTRGDRLENGTSSSSSSSSSGQNPMGSYGWSCTDSGGSMVFHDSNNSHNMMDLALSSQPMDWNQPTMFRDETKGGLGFRSMIQETASSDTSFDMDTAMYGSPTAILQAGLLGSEIGRGQSHHQSALENRYLNNSYQYGGNNNYGLMMNSSTSELLPAPLMLRASPPKQQQHSPHAAGHLHFSNNAPFWNPSAAGMKDARSNYSPSLHIDEKPKNLSEFTVINKSGMSTEPSSKTTRNETPSSLPAFKVRKEKMGDRITALQQLVSPFGKTDTASVLSEAIEYIKILHEQVTVLSAPYMKSGATTQQHHQEMDHKVEEDPDDQDEQDLRSRGLCLVPVASTFPVTHEPTLDFWSPPFGGSYR